MQFITRGFKFGLWVIVIVASLMNNEVSAQNWSLKGSVMASVEINETKPSILLKWSPESTATKYTIYRKLKDAKAWGSLKATLAGTEVSYLDTTVQIGQTYEYRITRAASDIPANGYLYAAIKGPAIESKNAVLLLIDSRIQDSLKTSINRLKNDLYNEGWDVMQVIVDKKATVPQVKDLILNQKALNPKLKTLFIIGHVIVPYAGNDAYDGHPDHIGAWPADSYYADLDGTWTDDSVDNTDAGRTENKNSIGDGKFDQAYIPSDLELEVGRVDFFNMPAFSKNEIQLLRQYFDKDHKFRTGQIKARRRGVVLDNFNFQNEGFAQSGYRACSAFFGPDSTSTADYRTSLLNGSYLWSYGAGGGWYEGAGGISTTQNMAVDSLQGIFTFLFGSYFGDWDSPNNFMRSALGSGTILTCAWAGRPGWQMQHMAMGEHIGFSSLLSQNNNTLYINSPNGRRGVHAALMGDPTLVMYPMLPVSNLTINEVAGLVELNWGASPDASEGYLIQRKKSNESTFQTIARNVVGLKYLDKCLNKDTTYEYRVCATKLEKNASGSFYNVSAGLINSITITHPDLAIDSIMTKDENAGFNQGKFLGAQVSGGTAPFTYTIKGNLDPNKLSAGTYTLIVEDANGCRTEKEFIIRLNTSNHEINSDHVIIYPQPADDFLYINTSSKWELDGVRLMNPIGIESNVKVEQTSQNIGRILVQNLKPGWYMIKGTNGNKHFEIPFIKL